MKLFGERHRRRPRLEILPMIDVMLLLLVYYILSTITLGHEHGIPVKLPEAATGEAAARHLEVMITITKDGEFYLGKDRIRPDEVVTAVKALAERTPGGLEALQQTGVVINADLTVQHRLVVSTMDALRVAGITQFAIATEPEAKQP